ncbi:MAG: hypothetical protein IPM54_06865 [Polyangiaceae bacterium]|nr:hypothetical protein [Polyangiaceae bacterium]
MKKLLGLMGCASLLVACANEVIIEPNDDNGGSSSSSSGTSSSSSSSGNTATCVPQDDAPVSSEPTCDDLDRLVVVNPSISNDTDGDGKLESGESATLTVMMKDVSGLGFNWYPGVEFESSHPSIEVEPDTWFYAILPCTEQAATATIKVGPDVFTSTEYAIFARIAMLNHECPGTSALGIPMVVH